MALNTIIRFPIFAPPPQNLPHHHRPATEIRFSRWNNANAQKFIRHERTQKEIEDQLRFHKRFDSADKIANLHPTTTNPPAFKSTGTPSAPSRPSIPGKKSKYSKPLRNPKNPNSSTHPAFKRIVRLRKIPNEMEDETGIKFDDKGLSYVIPDAPFEFQYSYTETPKVKPIKLREPPITPFGPGTMSRPWTGKKPLPPSKKKLEFDSFRLPPPHKKGVKPVQAPGPFLPGSGPKYVKSREELLGEPLSKEEIDALIKGCLKSERQLNIGRDGLTHNMLDNIHAHWKRKRVCKIKCKGVCTVDMDNVRHQLEEKTGGKIIYSKGGVIYLFRGRNYNYKTRPIFPLMLWKPVTPVYPKLIQRAPDGLTPDEASEMRKKGRQLTPICKLGKNGVYCDLVKNVREAFEACELVRINCEGMNGSDYRKIGAKLKDLVPCVLISFEHEHILMWRGQDWKSMFTGEDDHQVVKNSNFECKATIAPSLESQSVCPSPLVKDLTILAPESSETESDLIGEEDEGLQLITSTPENIEKDDGIFHSKDHTESSPILSENMNNVVSLLNRAIEDGSAVILDDSCLNADIIYDKAVALAKSAPPGPTFRHHRPKKMATEVTEKQEAEEKEVTTVSERKESEKRSKTTQRKGLKDKYLDVVPQGVLRVDELAKLLG